MTSSARPAGGCWADPTGASAGLPSIRASSRRTTCSSPSRASARTATSTWWLPRPIDPVAGVALRSVGVDNLVIPPSSVIGTAPLVPTPLVGLDPSFTVAAAATDLGTGADDPVLAARRWFGTVAAGATLAGRPGSATVALIDPATADPDVVERAFDLAPRNAVGVEADLDAHVASRRVRLEMDVRDLERRGRGRRGGRRCRHRQRHTGHDGLASHSKVSLHGRMLLLLSRYG